MDSAFLEGPLLCVSSILGHWLLSLVRFLVSIKTMWDWKIEVLILTLRGTYLLLKTAHALDGKPTAMIKLILPIIQVAFHQLSKIFQKSVTEKDLLYAANWAVSLLQVGDPLKVLVSLL